MANIYYQRTTESGLCMSAESPEEVFSGDEYYHMDVIINTLNDDGRNCYVLIAGHEKSWPEKRVMQKNDRFTIHYITKGQGTFNNTKIKEGSCFVVFPGQEYTLINDPDNPLEKYWISLRGPQTTDYITRAHFDRMPPVFKFDYREKILKIFNDMIYEPHTDADLELYLFGCFNILLSFHKAANEKEEEDKMNFNAGHNYYEMAKEYIMKRYNERLTVKDIAEHIHISESYLRALFMKFEGRPIGEIIIDCKLEAAKSLLAVSEYSVNQISGIIGYSDYSTFSKLFKKKMNCSPTEYRRMKTRR